MATYVYVDLLLGEVFEHVSRTGHQIVSSDNYTSYDVGFACTSCPNIDWVISYRDVKHGPENERSMWRNPLLTGAGRRELVNRLNRIDRAKLANMTFSQYTILDRKDRLLPASARARTTLRRAVRVLPTRFEREDPV
jgi:hypothetical protein